LFGTEVEMVVAVVSPSPSAVAAAEQPAAVSMKRCPCGAAVWAQRVLSIKLAY